MRYMMLRNEPSHAGGYPMEAWDARDVAAHGAYFYRYMQELTASGEWVGGQGLAPPRQARRVRAGTDGKPVTDGVFPEAKEFLAGYWVVDVDSPERAYELAAKASAAPGPGGAPLNMPVEVREVMSAPPRDA